MLVLFKLLLLFLVLGQDSCSMVLSTLSISVIIADIIAKILL